MSDNARSITFKDHIAMVTGGASGIGRGLAQALLERGATVVVLDIEQAAIEATVEELGTTGEIHGYQVDLARGADVQKVADRVNDEVGLVSLIFNNAGVSSGQGPIWEQKSDDFQWLIDVNVMGGFNVLRSFLPPLLASSTPGWVVTTSSGDGGIAPSPSNALYSATKAMGAVLTESLANQLSESRVGVSLFYPSGGLTPSNIWNSGRNRPARYGKRDAKPRFADFGAFLAWLKENGNGEVHVLDPVDLGRTVLDGISQGNYVICADRDMIEELLIERAQAMHRAMLPPNIGYGLTARRQGIK